MWFGVWFLRMHGEAIQESEEQKSGWIDAPAEAEIGA